MKIDSTSHFGYVVDKASKSVLVYDLSESSFIPVTSIPTGLAFPVATALDENAHRLAVADLNKPSVAIIDTDRASGSVNTLLTTVGTGSVTPLTVDIDNGYVYAGDFGTSDRVARVSIADGTVSYYGTSSRSLKKSLAVDPVSHIVYAAILDDKTIWELRPDGTSIPHAIGFQPTGMAIASGDVLVSSGSGLSRFDTKTWSVTATAPALANTGDVEVDLERQVIYVPGGAGEVNMLNASTLAIEGKVVTKGSILDVDHSVGTLVSAGSTVVELYTASPTVTRVGGADRFETSAAISRRQFASSPLVAFVASGAGFADALSASAAAGAQGGPVLLTERDKIPAAIAAELSRLKPQHIVVMGGTVAVSAAVQTALESYSPDVTRLSGADRFEVSAAVSRATFGPTRPVAYVASGTNFPDALSGSAAAGALGGPVLLVTPDTIPDPVKKELERLTPAKIVVLGGTAAINESVVDTLKTIQPNTRRTAGADRFAVSAAVSKGVFPTPTSTVYVASGSSYADALSGAAAAIATGSPVLLVGPTSIPADIARELDRLDPRRIVILGGTQAVDPAVEAQLRSYIAV
ncbi:cell wall-binding repeat-containing protein [Herbiconiux flava]|uniref:Putative cell wall-binding protein n=1 Tax=Herbiconiux flava TaxID=881268 RepID=A0A852SJQ2_9MICO|nr:cell wall-binding repeat-containing protein [Herbiconiux flava]NYD69740.1 putative cell wall-binding protein [Herbiconiux flava]